MTILLDGKAVAKYLFHPEPISSNKVIYRDISKKLSEKLTLAKQLLGDGFTPHLDIIHVNRQTESQLYIRKKMEAFRQIGFSSLVHYFGEGCTIESVKERIGDLNRSTSCHGIIIQSPVEIYNYNPQSLLLSLTSQVSIEKDVDGLNPQNSALIAYKTLSPHFFPCTPLGIINLLRYYGLEKKLHGARACVIGRSSIVGLPMAALLTRLNSTVTLCHSASQKIDAIVRESDIVLAALGKAELVRREWIRPGAIVIDVGINKVIDIEGNPKLLGDVERTMGEVASAWTPVPGGVGPMTVAMLLTNVFNAAIHQSSLSQDLKKILIQNVLD